MLCSFCKNNPITFRMTHVYIYIYIYEYKHIIQYSLNVQYNTSTQPLKKLTFDFTFSVRSARNRIAG